KQIPSSPAPAASVAQGPAIVQKPQPSPVNANPVKQLPVTRPLVSVGTAPAPKPIAHLPAKAAAKGVSQKAAAAKPGVRLESMPGVKRPEASISYSGLPEWKGTTSRIQNFRTVVIQSAGEWKRLWKEAGNPGQPPAVDFEQYT